MKIIKLIGLICLFCFTFFYTEKIITVTKEQDEIMIKIKEFKENNLKQPINAIIEDDTIIPGQKGSTVNTESSYQVMKKIGYFEQSKIIYEDIYPEISIYNNYNKYIIKGNTSKKKVSIIYIINNSNTIDNILSSSKNTKLNFFIDSSYLNNNIQIINKLKDHEIYNYGNNGTYTKDNIIITNNIINNKANNNSIYCLFLKKEINSLNQCTNSKMHSIIPTITGNYNDIKRNLTNGSIILINNTQELNNIIEYINGKGYEIVPLSQIIFE